MRKLVYQNGLTKFPEEFRFLLSATINDFTLLQKNHVIFDKTEDNCSFLTITIVQT